MIAAPTGKPVFKPAVSSGLSREVVGILHRARDRVSQGWTQRVHARDKDNKPVHPEVPGAVCWCIAGSLHPASESAKPILISSIREAIGETDIVGWNDNIDRTPGEVIAALTRAIEIVEHL